MNRNLDGVYFRMKRDDKFENICFSDMSGEEREEVWEKNQGVEYWQRMTHIMADTIRDIFEQLELSDEGEILEQTNFVETEMEFEEDPLIVKKAACVLADTIKDIGDQLDLVRE